MLNQAPLCHAVHYVHMRNTLTVSLDREDLVMLITVKASEMGEEEVDKH